MKLQMLIKKLEKIQAKHGNVDVLIQAGNDPYSFNSVDFKIAEQDEYPADYDMPAGFKFVLLDAKV